MRSMLSLAFVEDNEHGLLLVTGIACATAQCVLWLLFSFALGDGPWRREPGFTAHQVICFPLMIYLTYLGLSNFGGAAPFDTPVSRVFAPHPVGAAMTKIVLGELLLWDTSPNPNPNPSPSPSPSPSPNPNPNQVTMGFWAQADQRAPAFRAELLSCPFHEREHYRGLAGPLEP